MSNPSLFSKYCFDDGGTYRMAYRGDNARSFRDEELFASSSGVSGKVLSCTNANEVFTRLRPIRLEKS